MDEIKDTWTVVIAYLKGRLKGIDDQISENRKKIAGLKDQLTKIPKQIESLNTAISDLQNEEDMFRNALKEYNLCPKCYGSGIEYILSDYGFGHSSICPCSLCKGKRYIIPESISSPEDEKENMLQQIRDLNQQYNNLMDERKKLQDENGELKKIINDRE